MDYASDTNRIAGVFDETLIHSLAVFAYDFSFYIPPNIVAESDNIAILLQSKYGFNRLTGGVAVLAKLNGQRVSSDSHASLLRLWSDAPFSSGENTFIISNSSGAYSSYSFGGGCSYSKPGLCTFKVCGFYPNLIIETNTAPSSINYDQNFSVTADISDVSDVDAGSVDISVTDSDFYVSPQKTTQIILAKSESPFNEIKYTLTFTPKKYVELDTGASSVPKRIGKIIATFTDSTGKPRTFEKNLGAISVLALIPPVNEPPAISPPTSTIKASNSQLPSQVPSNNSSLFFGLPFSFVLLLVILSALVVLVAIAIIIWHVFLKRKKR